VVSVAVNFGETVALGIAAWLTGSASLRAQTADNIAELAVGLFLWLGVATSSRPTDDSHPLGYGRERFFWALFAALGIFVGGGGLAINGAIQSALHPSPITSFGPAYLILFVTVLFDALILIEGLRPLRMQAIERGILLRAHLLQNTDPVSTTVVASGGCAVLGGLIAAAGLGLSQWTKSSTPDTVASALIGVLLLATSAFLLKANRELLTDRGVSPAMVAEMRKIIAAQNGVVNVPDLFAVVVGQQSLIVNGDVTFADELAVPAVEKTIMAAAAALRERWPAIEFVYLTPVPLARPRRVRRSGLRKDAKKR
jgi:cation diffusion facilitator family transporter